MDNQPNQNNSQNPQPNNMPTGLEPSTNFTKQSIIGGVEETKAKSKPLFSMPSILSGNHKEEEKPAAPQPTPTPAPVQAPAPAVAPVPTPAVVPTPVATPPTAASAQPVPQPVSAQQPIAAPPSNTVPPSYNEITAPSKKSKFAVVAIIIGVVLLTAAGAGYYYISTKPAEVVPEPEPEPVVEVEDQTIDQDPFIMQLEQLESTASAEPVVLREHLESIEVQNIDMELQDQMDVEAESQTTETDLEGVETPDQP